MEDTKAFAKFERLEEFERLQNELLGLDLHEIPDREQEMNEAALSENLALILAEYQEQSYLLDPFLDQLVAPVVERLKLVAKASVTASHHPGSPVRVDRLARLLYNYIKCRGRKTIVRYFPHEVADLTIALEYMLHPDGLAQESSQWALRYVILLWLSLICLLPFNLAQFDKQGQDGYTASSMELLAKRFLSKAGLERDGAALQLARLYMRKDTGAGFRTFISWSVDYLQNTPETFTVMGLLQVICEVLKSGPLDLFEAQISLLLELAHNIDLYESVSNNSLIRKYKTKLISRIALRTLPSSTKENRTRGKLLNGQDAGQKNANFEHKIHVSDEVENILDQLLTSLQDKDTIVRWSASKAVARVAERLPDDFTKQILGSVIGLFTIHSTFAASIYDIPAIAESTWHGACLACAEMARRNLIDPGTLPELMEWLGKALYFDLRKGSHSIGSNVRDAASYVLWALARSQDCSLLVPHANSLAKRLVTVALYDREIHIRRAASAAFQEHVGRTSLFPHGIDVLAKTDFYAVSIRRNAFLISAPSVAEHEEYRQFLFDHIINVVLRHWDPTMRELGSQSLRMICLVDLSSLGEQVIVKTDRLLTSSDAADVHGGLMALSELAIAYRSRPSDFVSFEPNLHRLFECIGRVPASMLLNPRNELVTIAACRLIMQSVTLSELNLKARFKWTEIMNASIKHRSTSVQEAGSQMLGRISGLTDCTDIAHANLCVLSTWIEELQNTTPAFQQSLVRLLGEIRYDEYPASLGTAFAYLFRCAQPNTNMKSNIEMRRLCHQALTQILVTVVPRNTTYISSEDVNKVFSALLHGLDDYTIDERGDVGSWIRVVCMQGLTAASEVLVANADLFLNFEEHFPTETLKSVVAGILKQGVERLDNVRQEAGECFMRIILINGPKIEGGDRWHLPRHDFLEELLVGAGDRPGWNDGNWLFPRAVRLLDIHQYRYHVLSGIIHSISSQTDSTKKTMARSLVDYVSKLPVHDKTASYDMVDLVGDLLERARPHFKLNSIIIPIFQTFNVLFESDALEGLDGSPHGLESLHSLIRLATKGVSQLKNVQRMLEGMKIVVNLLPIEALLQTCVALLIEFLAHPFPHVRAETAEYMYIKISTVEIGIETDEFETILLETEWLTIDIEEAQEAAGRFKDLLS